MEVITVNKVIILVLSLLFCCNNVFAYQLYPDGSYGPDGDFQRYPNGTYGPSGNIQLHPDGSYGDTEEFELAPNGSFIDSY